MSETEIAEFNRKHMVEVDMTDNKYQYQAAIDKLNRSTDKDIAECGQDKLVDAITHIHKEVWNLAIEKAIEVCNKYESYGAAYEIRTLKL